jgi:hypothetical protein
VPEQFQAQIDAETELAVVERWLVRATSAASIDEVFG